MSKDKRPAADLLGESPRHETRKTEANGRYRNRLFVAPAEVKASRRPRLRTGGRRPESRDDGTTAAYAPWRDRPREPLQGIPETAGRPARKVT